MRLLPLAIFVALPALAGLVRADDPKEFTAARKIYVAKCAKCHQFYEPASYSEPEWETWMEKMARKSKLKPGQAALLDRYLDAYRAGRLAGKPETKR